MMRCTTLFLLALLATSVLGQRDRYIRYNRMKERARAIAAQGDPVAAVVLYDSAFSLIPWVALDHIPAVVNALAAGRDDRANALLLEAVENGFDLERNSPIELQAFLGSDRAIPFLEMRRYMEQRFLDHADTASIRVLRTIGTGSYMRRGDTSEYQVIVDPGAMDRLLALVEQVGFPTAFTVGPACETIPYLIKEWAPNYPDGPYWTTLLPAINKAIAQGKLEPEYLCTFQDLADHDADRPMTYGVAMGRYLQEPRIVLAPRSQLEQARAALGLSPIDHAIEELHTYPAKFVFAEEP